jgi:hypothetical protein
MTEAQKQIVETAKEMAKKTEAYVDATAPIFEDQDCENMYDLDNKLEIYLYEVEIGNEVDEAIDVLSSIIPMKPFVDKMTANLEV